MLCGFFLLIAVAILYRRHFKFFAENTVKMFHVLIADGKGDIFHCHIPVFQKRPCLFHADGGNQFPTDFSWMYLLIYGPDKWNCAAMVSRVIVW